MIANGFVCQNVEQHMIFNKHRRWFHSSLEKLPLVRMSASWFLVSTYLIWILGSKLILSNYHPRATLWVLDTCLTEGLRPWIVILITASLSSKMYNLDSPWEGRVLVSTLSTSLNCSTLVFDWCVGSWFWNLKLSGWVDDTQVSWASMVGLDLAKFPRASVTKVECNP